MKTLLHTAAAANTRFLNLFDAEKAITGGESVSLNVPDELQGLKVSIDAGESLSASLRSEAVNVSRETQATFLEDLQLALGADKDISSVHAGLSMEIGYGGNVEFKKTETYLGLNVEDLASRGMASIDSYGAGGNPTLAHLLINHFGINDKSKIRQMVADMGDFDANNVWPDDQFHFDTTNGLTLIQTRNGEIQKQYQLQYSNPTEQYTSTWEAPAEPVLETETPEVAFAGNQDEIDMIAEEAVADAAMRAKEAAAEPAEKEDNNSLSGDEFNATLGLDSITNQAAIANALRERDHKVVDKKFEEEKSGSEDTVNDWFKGKGIQ